MTSMVDETQKAKSPGDPTEAVAPTRNPPIHLALEFTVAESEVDMNEAEQGAA
jgi:hypothetical protein